jgi:hypothetical protein
MDRKLRGSKEDVVTVAKRKISAYKNSFTWPRTTAAL